MIKARVATAISAAIEIARSRGRLAATGVTPMVTVSPGETDSAWTTKVAWTLPCLPGQAPHEIAHVLAQAIVNPSHPFIEGATADSLGTLTLFVRPNWQTAIPDWILSAASREQLYRTQDDCPRQKVLVEFVSSNPNGPITVNAGRNAAIGDTIARLLGAVGYHVSREYYVNDALGTDQLGNFGKSVWHRYRQLLGHPDGLSEVVPERPLSSPSDIAPGEVAGADITPSARSSYRTPGGIPGKDPAWLYHGDYVTDIARSIVSECGVQFEDAPDGDAHTLQQFRERAMDGMIAAQQSDLEAFGVTFDCWFRESTLHADGRALAAIDALTAGGCTYEKDGAVWLRSTKFGDSTDRVLVRANGSLTYIATDAAYHKDKFDRGFDTAIDIWGVEHAGYVARTRAALAVMGIDHGRLEIILHERVVILEDGEVVKASRRHCEALELRADLVDRIGRDATRFLYLSLPPSRVLEIDIVAVNRAGAHNPYRLARSAEQRLSSFLADISADSSIEHDWQAPDTAELAAALAGYGDAVVLAAHRRAPEELVGYIVRTSALVHAFFDMPGGPGPAQTGLAAATLRVLHDAFDLLGVWSGPV
ncbi:MAG: arginine--tRNA ligase [Capsulimonadaceae bacterium]